MTRPGFIRGIQALAASDEPTPHLAEHRALAQGRPRAALRSQRRRDAPGDALVRLRPVPRRVLLRAEDDAVLSRGTTGLKVEQIESYYDDYKFPDGHRFYDWQHAETGARGAQGAASRVRDCGARASTRGAASPAPTATCRTSARAR